VVQAPAQHGDAVARQPAVRLDLRLARASGADAADAAPGAEALEVRPQPAHAGHVVLELRQLDLQLALGRVRVVGEDVEDHGRAVHDRHVEQLLEVALLPRGELVVAGDHVGVRRLGERLQLLDLALAQVVVGMRLLTVLHQLADDRHARGAQQLLQLGQVVALGHHADDVCALLRAPLGLWCSSVAALLHLHPSVGQRRGAPGSATMRIGFEP
jgi:hypothetical protein